MVHIKIYKNLNYQALSYYTIMSNFLEKSTFAENEIFKCKNCNIRMTPITVEIDY